MNTCDYCGGVLIEIGGELVCLNCDYEEEDMTADEAKQALKAGKKVRCKNWSKDQYIYQEIKIVANLFGGEDIFDRFTADDWEIFKDDNWDEEE